MVVAETEAASVVKVAAAEEEATVADGEVVEEANGGGRWCAHTPCCPEHHGGVRGGHGRFITSMQSRWCLETPVFVPTPKRS